MIKKIKVTTWDFSQWPIEVVAAPGVGFQHIILSKVFDGVFYYTTISLN